MRWARIAAGVGLALVAVVALAVGGTLTILRTDWGSDLARRIAIPRLNAAIAGRVEVGRLRYGGDRVSLSDVVLRGPENDVVLRVREIAVTFAPLSLMRGHVAVSEARLVGPSLSLRRQGDTLNLLRAVAPKIPPSSPPGQPGRPASSASGPTIDVADLRVVDGELDVGLGEGAGDTELGDVKATEIAVQGSGHFEPGPNAFEVTVKATASVRAPLPAPLGVHLTGQGRGDRLEAALTATLGAAAFEVNLQKDGSEQVAARLSRAHVTPELVRAFLPAVKLRVPVDVRADVQRAGDALAFTATIDSDAGAVAARGAGELAARRARELKISAVNVDLGALIEGLPRSSLSLSVEGEGGGVEPADARGEAVRRDAGGPPRRRGHRACRGPGGGFSTALPADVAPADVARCAGRGPRRRGSRATGAAPRHRRRRSRSRQPGAGCVSRAGRSGGGGPGPGRGFGPGNGRGAGRAHHGPASAPDRGRRQHFRHDGGGTPSQRTPAGPGRGRPARRARSGGRAIGAKRRGARPVERASTGPHGPGGGRAAAIAERRRELGRRPTVLHARGSRRSLSGGNWSLAHPARLVVRPERVQIDGLELSAHAQRLRVDWEQRGDSVHGAFAVDGLDLAALPLALLKPGLVTRWSPRRPRDPRGNDGAAARRGDGRSPRRSVRPLSRSVAERPGPVRARARSPGHSSPRCWARRWTPASICRRNGRCGTGRRRCHSTSPSRPSTWPPWPRRLRSRSTVRSKGGSVSRWRCMVRRTLLTLGSTPRRRAWWWTGTQSAPSR